MKISFNPHLSRLSLAILIQLAYATENTYAAAPSVLDQAQDQDILKPYLDQIRSLRSDIQGLDLKNIELEKLIGENGLQKTAIEQKIADLIQQIANLLSQKGNVDKFASLLKNIPDDQKANFDEKVANLSPLLSDYKKLLADLDAKERRVNALRDVMPAKTQAKENLSQKYESLKAEYADLKSSQESGNAGVKASNQELLNTSFKVSELEKQRAALEKTNLGMGVDINTLASLIANEEQKQKENKLMGSKNVVMSDADLKKKREFLKTKKTELAANSAKLKDLIAQIDEGKKSIEALKGAKNVDPAALNNKMKEVANMGKQLLKIDQDLKDAVNKEQKASLELDVLKSKVEAKKKEVMDAYAPIINALSGLPVQPSVEAPIPPAPTTGDFAAEQQVLDNAKNLLSGNSADVNAPTPTDSPEGMSGNSSSPSNDSLASVDSVDLPPAPNNSLVSNDAGSVATDVNNPSVAPSLDLPPPPTLNSQLPSLTRASSAPVMSSLSLKNEKEASKFLGSIIGSPTRCVQIVNAYSQYNDGGKRLLMAELNANKSLLKTGINGQNRTISAKDFVNLNTATNSICK